MNSKECVLTALKHRQPDRVSMDLGSTNYFNDTGGGYVMGSVHNMQSDVPPQNVEAMFKTALEYRI